MAKLAYYGSMDYGLRIKVNSSVVTLSIKNFPLDLHMMYLYFPDTVIYGFLEC
jgi:hypothetical protein